MSIELVRPCFFCVCRLSNVYTYITATTDKLDSLLSVVIYSPPLELYIAHKF